MCTQVHNTHVRSGVASVTEHRIPSLPCVHKYTIHMYGQGSLRLPSIEYLAPCTQVHNTQVRSGVASVTEHRIPDSPCVQVHNTQVRSGVASVTEHRIPSSPCVHRYTIHRYGQGSLRLPSIEYLAHHVYTGTQCTGTFRDSFGYRTSTLRSYHHHNGN